jgi:hypothetical protein
MRRNWRTDALLRMVVVTCAGVASAFAPTQVSSSRQRPFRRWQALPAFHNRREEGRQEHVADIMSRALRLRHTPHSFALASSVSWAQPSWNATFSAMEIPLGSSTARKPNVPVDLSRSRIAYPHEAQSVVVDEALLDGATVATEARAHRRRQDAASSSPIAASPTKAFHVYCDLDGLLVDFAHGISEIFCSHDNRHDLAGLLPKGQTTWTSHNIDALPRRMLWDKVQAANAFFEHLPWCEGGRELWTALAPLRPDILTGVPSYCSYSPRAEKFAWCQRELGLTVSDTVSDPARRCNDESISPLAPNRFSHVDKAGRFRMHYPVNAAGRGDGFTTATAADATDKDADDWNCKVITCWSEQKHHESGPGVVLIDDRISLRQAWEAKGGIFIHHITGNVEHTLRQLRQHGILTQPGPTEPNVPDNHRADGDQFLPSPSSKLDSLWEKTYLRP